MVVAPKAKRAVPINQAKEAGKPKETVKAATPAAAKVTVGKKCAREKIYDRVRNL